MKKKGMSTTMTAWIIDLVILLFITGSFFGVIIKIKDNTNHDLKLSSLEYSFSRIFSQIPYKNKELYFIYNYNPNITLSFSEPCIIKAKLKDEKLSNIAQYNCVVSDRIISEQFLENKIVMVSK